MSRTREELSGILYQMPAEQIRSVLRWLCNNVTGSVKPQSLISTMKQTECQQRILRDYSMFDIDHAVIAINMMYENKSKGVDLEPHRKRPLPGYGGVQVDSVIIDEAGQFDESMKPKLPDSDSDEALLKLLEKLRGGKMDENTVKEIAKAVARASIETLVPDMLLKQSEAFDDRLNIRQRDTMDSLGRVINTGLENNLKAFYNQLDIRAGKMREELLDFISKNKPTRLEVHHNDDKPIVTGIVHREQAKLIRYLAAGLHVYLPGPAGSGKSTAAEIAAEALKLDFESISVCQQTTKVDFLGYMDAEGVYHGTGFRKAYENGGLFLIDEIDKANPNTLAVLNSALSNTRCAFPDGMVKRHKKFRCVSTGNTWGGGKTLQYVGSNPIDAATTNRFAFIYWEYDEALETQTVGLPAWTEYVQKCRAEVKRRGIHFLITPRASYMGASLLKAGERIENILDDVLFPNMDPDTRRAMPQAPDKFIEEDKKGDLDGLL